jgi:hypothetical protein
MADWYYARAGQQFGPVSRMRIEEMARSGELQPKDLLWTESMDQWQPAGIVTGIFAVGAPPVPREGIPDQGSALNPYAAPQSARSEGASLNSVVPGSEPIDLGAIINRAFALTTRHFGFVFLVGVVFLIINIALGAGLTILDTALGWEPPAPPSTPTSPGDPSVYWSRQESPWSLTISKLVSIWLAMGLTRLSLNLAGGQAVSVDQLFGQGSKFLKYLVAHILLTILVVLGLVLFIVPGIYLALRYGQCLNAIIDQDLGVFEAFQYSSTITRNQKFPMLLVALASLGITAAGLLAACVGLFFAVPMVMLMSALAYRWMQSGHRAVQDV